MEDNNDYGFLARRAIGMARRPWLHLGAAFLISLGLSAVGLILGNFSVTADNAGWQSRGTLIADRHAQVLLSVQNRFELSGGSAAVWDDLINNVQPGWETEEGDDPLSVRARTRRNRKLQKVTTAAAAVATAGGIDEPFVDHRRLQLNTSAPAFESCDVGRYSYAAAQGTSLWPVWETCKESISALDPSVIRDICIAEENTNAVLDKNGLCTGCDVGCLAPFSLVFFARLQVGDVNFALSCQQLANEWSNVKDTVVPELQQCVEDIKTTKSYDPLPSSCPLGFHPALVDENFGTNNNKSRYTSSVFFTTSQVDGLYDQAGDYDRADSSSVVRGAYDTQWEDFVEIFVDSAVQSDMILAMGSAAITATAILLHTRSPWVTLVGLTQIILSFPLAFFVYTFIGRLEFFPFLNFIGVFVVFALGADDVFVAVDKWKNARLELPDSTTEEVAARALPDAAGAMFLTTLTTAVAFFATAICPVAPLKMFAVFNGLLITFDYIMCVVLVFPALCLYDKWLGGCCCGCCVSLHCCKKKEYDDEEGDEASNADKGGEPDEESKPSLIRRILYSFYDVLHLLRWPLLAACVASLIVTAIFASRLELPQSSDVRLLTDDNQYEQNFLWRKFLLSTVIDESSGSAAVVIWGVTPADTGNINNPESFTQLVLDESFDPTSTEAQQYLVGFCDRFYANEWADFTDQSITTCPINDFDAWLRSNSNRTSPSSSYSSNCGGATGLPMDPATFDQCITAFAQATDEDKILSREGDVKIMYFRFQTRVRFDSPYDELDKEWNAIESYLENERQTAPAGINKMYHSSSDFWWYDTNGKMLQTAFGAAAIALGAAGLVVLISSRSFVLTIFSIFTIGYVLTSTTAMLVASGWTLGFLESVCFAILIGISCDFVIHFGHAYAHVDGDVDRHTRTKNALIRMGPSILAAAFTTICAAAIMLFTVILFFQRFAIILFFTIIQATVGSFLVYLTLTDTLGPAHPTYLFDLITEKFNALRGKEPEAEPSSGKEVVDAEIVDNDDNDDDDDGGVNRKKEDEQEMRA